MQVTLTIPDALYRRAQQLALSRQSDVVEVITAVLDESLPAVAETDTIDWSEPDEAVDREMAAYIALHPMLKERYLGQHVAILGGQLVDHDHDLEALSRRIYAQYAGQFVWITAVREMPIDTFRNPSIHLVTETG
jgi:hypothetical protein